MKIFQNIFKNLKDNLTNLPYGKKVALKNTTNDNEIKTISHINENILKKIDREVITQSLLNLYLRDLLNKIKNETVIQYENEAEKQRLMSESSKDKHSPTHAKLLKNTEKLLNNITIINDELAQIELIQDNCKEHIKERLNFASIEKVSITKINKK